MHTLTKGFGKEINSFNGSQLCKNEKVDSWHVPAIKFIEKKQLV